MKFSYKHIALVTGIVVIIVSFLFFGRKHDIYFVASTVGFLLALISYLFILFGKSHFKAKLLWTVVVICLVLLQQWSEPHLIHFSYRLYINKNEKKLSEVSSILLSKKSDVFILNNTITAKEDTILPNETIKLIESRKKLDVYMITKYEDKVYFGLWGFLDVRLGITFIPGQTKSFNQYTHITGNWFY